MADESEILKEVRGLREQLREIGRQLRLLQIYQVDPGAAALPEGAVETRGRLQADDAFVQEHEDSMAGKQSPR